jgi:hypothetical protein
MELAIHHRLALVGAAATSSIALSDAITQGVTGHNSIFADTSGVKVAIVFGGLVHGLTYAALAWVLVKEGPAIDAVNRAARVLRRVLMTCLASLSVGFVVIEPLRSLFDPPALRTPWGVVASLAFAGMLLSALALGPVLLRQPAMRLGARLLSLMVPLFGVTLLVGMAAPNWGHPAYLETCLNFGVALLGASIPAERHDRFVPSAQEAGDWRGSPAGPA